LEPLADATLRPARLDDVAAIEALIERSVRGLQTGDYDAEQIERSLRLVFGVDRRLISDETYFLIARRDGAELLACGGWSYRRTLFGADAIHARDDAELTPGEDAAKIRAFFVAPEHARRGLADRLLAHCEAQARARGYDRLELGATLTGEPMYARRGFVAVERLEAPLSGGVTLPIVRMTKRWAPTGRPSPA
jgi:GNAT superfamily N-acetyltransferase